MYFTKVELHNFGIYKGTHEMVLCDRIGTRNITLVGGLNGRGKTTFHDAILLALYGKSALKYIQENAKSYDKLLLDHINKHAEDNITYVAVTLQLDDGTTVRVKRSWSEKNNHAVQDTEVERNGVLDHYLGDNWNYYIEEILPFGIARFFFFNNEKITQLADDTSFEQIKASIKSAIGVTTIEKTITHVDEVIRRKNNALEAYENSEENKNFKEVEAQLADITTRAEALVQTINTLELRCQEYDVEVEAKERDFWASGGELSKNRDSIKAQMRRISEDMESIQAELIQLATEPGTPLVLCAELVKQAYENEIQMQNSSLQEQTEKQMAQAFKRITDRLKGLEIEAKVMDQLLTIMNEELGSHINSSESYTHQSLSATSIMLFEKLLSDTISSRPQRIRYLVNRVDNQENELMSLDAYLGDANEKTMAMRLYEALKSVEKEKNLADDELRRQNEQLESLHRQRDVLMSKRLQLIKTLTEKENKNDNNARIIKYSAMSMEVLNEFKVRLQREKVNKLSATITACFKQLVEKDSLVSKISVAPDSLDVTIYDIEGNELLKNQLSAGEQQMFAISIVWALALTSGYKSPVIIDTPMARLDSENRANFVKNYLPAASSQVVVLSTDEEIIGRYHDMIRSNVIDYYTLQYREDEQCTSIINGYFEEA